MKFEYKDKKKKFKLELTLRDYIFWSTVFGLGLNKYESIKSLINGFFYKKKVRFGTV